jgi:hypothetical protein
MTRTLRRLAALLLGGLALAALVGLSRAPYRIADGTEALLRLSWSGRPERVERCRELTDQELANVPAHMRQRVQCEGHPARYVVRVTRNAKPLSIDTVTGGGLRGDRSIHMLREYRLPAGAHTLAVEIARLDTVRADSDDDEHEDRGRTEHDEGRLDRDSRERDERRRQRQERLPARLALDTTVRLAPGAVLLVSYDPVERRLTAAGAAAVAGV